VPHAKQVAYEASRTAEALHEWLDHLHLETREKNPPMLKERYQLLLAALAQDEHSLTAAKTATDHTPANWDSATQLYLGLAALRHGLSDLGDNRPGLKEALVSLRRHLEQAFPEEHDRLYNSPSRFNPAEIDIALRQIQEQLQ
jgi:hypothetical protein